MFSKACEYGIKATMVIALNSYQGNRISLKDIASKIDSPVAFTAKILQKLVHHDIINSTKGVNGGFEIEKQKISKIGLNEIVNAIDGDTVYQGCGLGLKICDENHPCPMHDKFLKVREGLREMLENTNLEELVLGLKSGNTFLKV